MAQPVTHYDGRCGVCDTVFATNWPLQSDEDGAPIYRHDVLHCAKCHRELCAECAEHEEAFRCATCHKLFCAAHRHTVSDEHYCPACYPAALEADYERVVDELAAAKREVAAYAETCERIAVLFGNSDIERARALGLAQGIATSAPHVARSAALRAA